VARADDGDPGTAEQTGRAAHPEHRRWIVDLLEPLRIFGATVGDQRRTLRSHARPLLLGHLTSLAVEEELHRLGGKLECFERSQRQLEDLAGRLQMLDRIENPLGAEAGRENEGKPSQTILVERGSGDCFNGLGDCRQSATVRELYRLISSQETECSELW